MAWKIMLLSSCREGMKPHLAVSVRLWAVVMADLYDQKKRDNATVKPGIRKRQVLLVSILMSGMGKAARFRFGHWELSAFIFNSIFPLGSHDNFVIPLS